MATIKLTRGFITLVDDELFDSLNSYHWYASGVEGRPARRLKTGPRKLIYIYHQILHILPWVISKYGFEVDHINGNPLDNRKDNLRVVTHRENMRNTLSHIVQQGYCYDNTHNKWKVYVDRPNRARINIGTYRTKDEAKSALAQARLDYGICIDENN